MYIKVDLQPNEISFIQVIQDLVEVKQEGKQVNQNNETSLNLEGISKNDEVLFKY